MHLVYLMKLYDLKPHTIVIPQPYNWTLGDPGVPGSQGECAGLPASRVGPGDPRFMVGRSLPSRMRVRVFLVLLVLWAPRFEGGS